VFLAKVRAREISRLSTFLLIGIVLEGREFELIVKMCQKLPELMRNIIETEISERQFEAM